MRARVVQAEQAWHFPDTRGGAQGVVSQSAPGSSRHSRRGSFSTPEGLRRGWSPYARQGRPRIAGVAFPRHLRRCAGGGLPMRARVVQA
eukprot:8358006-Pyramimonas_sp.AAC.1